MLVASITLFVFRGILMLCESQLLQSRILRTLPHLIDTALLSAGIYLAVITRQYPLVQHWLTMKLGLLIVYILLGTLALKRGRTKEIRTGALIAAICTFGFMITVAYYRDPLGLFYSITL